MRGARKRCHSQREGVPVRAAGRSVWRRGLWLLSAWLLSAAACQSEPSPDVVAPWSLQPQGSWYADRDSPILPQAKHIVWFGHSLLVTQPGFRAPDEPALDLPALVAELLDAARAAGKTDVPRGRSITFAEGPYGFDYWLDGGGHAREKLVALRDEAPWTHVVGIGLMHLLGQKHFAWPNLYEWLAPFTREQRSVPARTRNVYRFMGLSREVLPTARWVNYVGPALANHAPLQPAIDARFACIRDSVQTLGVPLTNAPVGRAFRMAEARARERGLKLALQHDDFLHLRPAGALLAAQVLLASIHGVDSTGLPAPARYKGRVGEAAVDEEAVLALLAQTARDAVAAEASARCPADARVAEDAQAKRWLSR